MAKLSDPVSIESTNSQQPAGAHSVPKWTVVGGGVVLVLAGILAAGASVLPSMARSLILNTLQQSFASDLQLQNLSVSLFPSVVIGADTLVFRRKSDPADPPLLQIARFTGEGNILGLLGHHLRLVRLEGLDIHVPPKNADAASPPAKRSKSPYFAIDELIADGTTLSTIPREKWKKPLVFNIKTLRMHNGGSNSPLAFDAVLINAKPPGEINSKGKFGPWDRDEPGDTPVSGTYTFRNADLSVFKGIAGTLSSDGNYSGTLAHIDAAGHTDVPNFLLTLAGNPVHLTADYQAVIDGTSGNTYLHPVNAQFGHSTLIANGSVESQEGVKGKTVTLDAVVSDGRLEDMLQLGVHGTPPLSGAISFHSKIVIPPGNVDVIQKLKLDGAFVVASAQFSQLNIQKKVNDLSHRGEGNTDDADAPTVASDFRGRFLLDEGVLDLRGLAFNVPGVAIALTGKYELPSQSLHFRGTASLDAKLSQTTTGFKSTLLKALDPLFKRKGSAAGAVIPIAISGTKDKPSFGLDIFHRGDK